MDSEAPDRRGENKGPLAGLRVLDLSRVLAGPWCAQILGDLGAEVIKVEHPQQRDDTRKWGPPFLDDGSAQSDAAYYLCCNRNKHSIAIDFGDPEGAEVVRRLAATSDIVVENFKAGALAKYGLDYATLKHFDPALIYCSITGFGQTGPNAQRGGYDFLIQAMSGLMSVTGPRDGEPGARPTKVGIPVSDLFTGLYAAISILAAVNHRHATGRGQHLDCALFDTQVALLANQAMNFLVGGETPKRLGNAHPNVAPYRDFPTADGEIVIACGGDAQFNRLCHALGRPDLAADARLTANQGRSVHRGELEAALFETTRGWASADLLAALGRADVPAGPVNAIDAALAEPQVSARGLLHTLYRGEVPVKVIGYPVHFSESPPSYRAAPPSLGAQTREVLGGLLKMDGETLDRLEAAGVIGSSTNDAVAKVALSERA